MKKEQSLQHLIVTEMPYELLKLLIEEKALSAFVRNLIKDTEVNSLVMPNYTIIRNWCPQCLGKLLSFLNVSLPT